MGRKSTAELFPEHVQSALIEQVLLREKTNQEISNWLLKVHKINMPKTNVYRYGKVFIDKYDCLVQLGMPPKIIVANILQIEALGIDQVKKELVAKLTDRGRLFSYLDDEVNS
ncbi:hypothetical protein [Crenothrix sp.]|uniref:hypothetical protein n=1 Tax=Crenothrix sp. TaxID=3100433 RepID=UPI00374D1D38